MSKKIILFSILTFLSTINHAKSLDLNWDSISQDEYIVNLIDCKTEIKSFDWSNTIWPKTNKNPKPLFNTIIDFTIIENQVLDFLYLEAYLAKEYDFIISSDMLQQEINRMYKQSKDSKKLSQLFAVLNNNPKSIALCIAKENILNAKKIEYKVDDSFSNYRLNQTTNFNFNIDATYQLPVIKENNLNRPFEKNGDFNFNLNGTFTSPEARSNHSAIWTGVEMIVWGGQNVSSTYLNTGGSYNPTTDSWTQLPQLNAPSPRKLHTAIWTGTKMMVWGGTNVDNVSPNANFNTGGSYNPTTGLWMSIQSLNAPSARAGHTAIWTGNRMVIWGGSNPANDNSGGIYNPISDSWIATPTLNAPESRLLHTAIWTGTEMIVWGGSDTAEFSLTFYNNGAKFNPSSGASGEWISLPTIGFLFGSRINHTAIWTGTEMIIWGGNDSTFNSYGNGAIYNSNTNLWRTVNQNSAPTSRTNHTSVLNGSEMIIWGGKMDGFSITTYNSGGRYDVSSDTWQPTNLNNSPTNRSNHSAIWTGTEMIIWGGKTLNTSNSVVNSGSRYYPTSNSWVEMLTNSQYLVSGTISGLIGSVTLRNTGVSDITLQANGAFEFGLQSDGSNYAVTIVTTPTNPNQLCQVSNATGVITGSNITDVQISCTTIQYNVGGMVSGLETGNFVTLSLNDGAEFLTLNSNTNFNFINALDDGSVYSVTVLTNPSNPNQLCSVVNGSGNIAGAHVADIEVNCVIASYSVGGFVVGLIPNNNLVLQNNTGDDLIISDNGNFVFPITVPDLQGYSVSILTSPTSPNQNCNLMNTTGVIAGSNITDVQISCTTIQYNVGGMVSGLETGNFVTLSLNDGAEFLTLNSNTNFNFINALDDGSVYSVTVLTNPSNPNQLCSVVNGSGNIAGAHVADIEVNCVIASYSVGGSVVGLISDNNLVLQNNLGDDLIVSDSGNFVFTTTITDLLAYDVLILTQPTDPIQTCSIVNNSGIISGGDINSVVITCEMGDDFVYKNGFE